MDRVDLSVTEFSGAVYFVKLFKLRNIKTNIKLLIIATQKPPQAYVLQRVERAEGAYSLTPPEKMPKIIIRLLIVKTS